MPRAYTTHKYLPNKYLLRWFADMRNGETRTGMWNQSGECNFTSSSRFINSDRCLVVGIEAKNIETRNIGRPVRCIVQDWLSFRWMTTASVPFKGIARSGAATIMPNYHALTLVTRDEKVTVFIDGNVKREPNLERKIIV